MNLYLYKRKPIFISVCILSEPPRGKLSMISTMLVVTISYTTQLCNQIISHKHYIRSTKQIEFDIIWLLYKFICDVITHIHCLISATNNILIVVANYFNAVKIQIQVLIILVKKLFIL